jgi:Electron transfer flavoprotein, alpha subunit
MSTFSNVWVFSDPLSRLAELMSGAKALGGQTQVFTLDAEQSTAAFQLGADRVWQLAGKPDDRIVEDYADTLVQALKAQGDSGLVLLPNSRRGKLLAARLGARLGAAVVNDASAAGFEGDALVAKHMVYGGLAFSDETLHTPFCVLTLSSGTFEAAKPDAAKSGTAQTLQWQEPAVAIVRTATQARESHSVDLDKARLVVSVGRGIGGKENIPLAQALCEAIGAELACSRPVAENEKWMEHERYVGISNLMLKPELYLAVGISGQIQHMVGANGAQTIVAINKDKNAPIFQYADYGLVGDLFTVLPALTRELAR